MSMKERVGSLSKKISKFTSSAASLASRTSPIELLQGSKNESPIEKELITWRDELRILGSKVAKFRHHGTASQVNAVGIARAIVALANHERLATNEDLPSVQALACLGETLESIVDSQKCSTDNEVKHLEAACDDLINGGFKELREWRKKCDKAKLDFAAAIHKVNAAQANPKFVVTDVHKLIELETDRERCHRELVQCERMLKRTIKRLITIRDAELLDALAMAVTSFEQRFATSYTQAVAIETLVNDALEQAVGARRRATTLKHRHASASARADEQRDISAIDHLLTVLIAAPLAAMRFAALGRRLDISLNPSTSSTSSTSSTTSTTSTTTIPVSPASPPVSKRARPPLPPRNGPLDEPNNSSTASSSSSSGQSSSGSLPIDKPVLRGQSSSGPLPTVAQSSSGSLPPTPAQLVRGQSSSGGLPSIPTNQQSTTTTTTSSTTTSTTTTSTTTVRGQSSTGALPPIPPEKIRDKECAQCHTMTRSGARIMLRDGTRHFCCKSCVMTLINSDPSLSTVNATTIDNVALIDSTSTSTSATTTTTTSSTSTSSTAVQSTSLTSSTSSLTLSTLSDCPPRLIAAWGAPFYEALVSLTKARCGGNGPTISSYVRLVAHCVALRHAGAPFVLPAVMLLCSPLPDLIVADLALVASLSSSSSSSSSSTMIDTSSLSFSSSLSLSSSVVLDSSTNDTTSALSDSLVDDDTLFSSSSSSNNNNNNNNNSSSSTTISLSTAATCCLARDLLEAFVMVDADLQFHNHPSATGRSLPGVKSERVISNVSKWFSQNKQ